MLEFTSKPSTEILRDDPLFSVDGTEWCIPTTAPAWVGLEMSTRFADEGLGAAQVFALRTCLGEDGFAALRGAKSMSQVDLVAIINACVGRCVGPKSLTEPTTASAN
jgi:hypothetical protein